MGENTIDKLDIEIATSADESVKGIDKLIASIKRLDNANSGFGSGLKKIHDKISNFVDGIYKKIDKANRIAFLYDKTKSFSAVGDIMKKQDAFFKQIAGTGSSGGNGYKFGVPLQNKGEVDSFYKMLDGLKPKMKEFAKTNGFGDLGRNIKSATKDTVKFGNTVDKTIIKTKTGLIGIKNIFVGTFTKISTMISKNIQKPVEKSHSALSKLGNIIKRVFVISALYRFANMLRKGVREGIENIAKGTERANKVMSEYASSFKYLSNSIGSALLPLLTALQPIITQVTDALADLFNMLGGLSARLFGNATTFIKANKTAVDYADSVGKAAEEAQKATGSFDRLNVLSFGASTPTAMFEEVEIPAETIAFAEKLSDLFQKIKEAAEPTVQAIKSLVDATEPLKTFVAQGLEDFYNNFIKPVGIWVLGEGLPQLIGIVERFINNIDWNSLNEVLKGFWTLLKDISILIFQGVIDFYNFFIEPIASFVMNEGLNQLYQFFKNLYDTINWESLRECVNNFWSALSNFFTNVTFTALMDFLNEFLLPLSSWTADAFMKFIDATTDFISDTDWNPLLNSLKELWKSLEPFAENVGTGLLWFYTDIILPLGKWAAEKAIPKALEVISKAIETINKVVDDFKPIWEDVADTISKTWQNTISPILTAVIDEGLTPLIDKGAEFVDKYSGYITKFYEVFVKPLLEFFNAYIAPCITDFVSLGIKDITNFLSTCADVAMGIIEALSGVITFISGVFTGDWKKAWEGIKSIFSGIWNGFASIIEGAVNAIINGVNFMIRQINKISITLPDVVGGGVIGFNIKEIQKFEMPKLAKGGVIDKPIIGLMGEYANAKSNPEIVAPQSLMYDTILEANGELASVIAQMAYMIADVIRENKTEVNIGDDEIARSAKRGNDRMARLTGK